MEEFKVIREKTIFECYKLDPQVGDTGILAPFPLLLETDAWRHLASSAEKLAEEIEAMEIALTGRPDLHHTLGLPRGVRRALRRRAGARLSVCGARLIRFDFHYTTEGWRLSEANTDVPGGFNEAAGFSRLMAAGYPGTRLAGDPCRALASAIRGATGDAAEVALVHATAYTDDRQVMMFLADALAEQGIKPHLLGPDHILWRDGRAFMQNGWAVGPVDLVFRFFPSEWLPNLPQRSQWSRYFFGSRTPLCNPATAILTQSKRLPLVWDRLGVPIPAWKSFLPETRDPRDCGWEGSDDWVLKPALGRVGEEILVPGATAAAEGRFIRKSAKRHPRRWAAQKRFTALPVSAGRDELYPCIGVYTVNGRAAGIYGRISDKPLINAYARDIAVLVKEE